MRIGQTVFHFGLNDILEDRLGCCITPGVLIDERQAIARFYINAVLVEFAKAFLQNADCLDVQHLGLGVLALLPAHFGQAAQVGSEP